MSSKLTIFSDGGARGNPGCAGIGFVIYKNNINLIREGEYVGKTTNNVAEYLAIIKALSSVLKRKIKVDEIECFLDSELVVNQLMGKYKVKKEHLKAYFFQVQTLISQLKITACNIIKFTHIPRTQNKEADELVNKYIDLYLNIK